MLCLCGSVLGRCLPTASAGRRAPAARTAPAARRPRSGRAKRTAASAARMAASRSAPRARLAAKNATVSPTHSSASRTAARSAPGVAARPRRAGQVERAGRGGRDQRQQEQRLQPRLRVPGQRGGRAGPASSSPMRRASASRASGDTPPPDVSSTGAGSTVKPARSKRARARFMWMRAGHQQDAPGRAPAPRACASPPRAWCARP